MVHGVARVGHDLVTKEIWYKIFLSKPFLPTSIKTLLVKSIILSLQIRCKFDPWVGKIPWRRKWQPAPVLLPRESREQRSLACYSP